MKKISVIEMIKKVVTLLEGTRFLDHCSFHYYVRGEDENFYLISNISLLDHKVYYDGDRDYIYFDKTTTIYELEDNI